MKTYPAGAGGAAQGGGGAVASGPISLTAVNVAFNKSSLEIPANTPTKVNLLFDGEKKQTRQSFDVQPTGDVQTFAIDPPRPGNKVTLQIAAWQEETWPQIKRPRRTWAPG